jgi:hypothetical protein
MYQMVADDLLQSMDSLVSKPDQRGNQKATKKVHKEIAGSVSSYRPAPLKGSVAV